MTDTRAHELNQMFSDNIIRAISMGNGGERAYACATILTVGQLMEERDKAKSCSATKEDVESRDTSTAMIKALRKAFANVDILASLLDFSDLTEITGYRFDKESRRTYFRIRGRMAVSDINNIAVDVNAVRGVLGLPPLKNEE